MMRLSLRDMCWRQGLCWWHGFSWQRKLACVFVCGHVHTSQFSHLFPYCRQPSRMLHRFEYWLAEAIAGSRKKQCVLVYLWVVGVTVQCIPFLCEVTSKLGSCLLTRAFLKACLSQDHTSWTRFWENILSPYRPETGLLIISHPALALIHYRAARTSTECAKGQANQIYSRYLKR